MARLDAKVVQRGWDEFQRLMRWIQDLDEDQIQRIARAVRKVAAMFTSDAVREAYEEIKGMFNDDSQEEQAGGDEDKA